MDIDNATSVLLQAASRLTDYRNGELLEQNLVNQPCFAQLNPALDCVWQVAITSPLYQRTPEWVPCESKVKTALCVLKAIQHQIVCDTIDFGKLYNPGYLADLEETIQIFKSIVLNITAYGAVDYPDLDNDGRGQLVAALQAALSLLEATKSLFGH